MFPFLVLYHTQYSFVKRIYHNNLKVFHTRKLGIDKVFYMWYNMHRFERAAETLRARR